MKPDQPPTPRPLRGGWAPDRGAFESYVRHVNPTLGRFLKLSGRGFRLSRAHGAVLEDDQGRRFDDWIAGFGSLNLGHNPPAVLDALRRQLDAGAPGLYVEALNPYSGRLADALAREAGPSFGTCFFANSGSEAVEAALKTAINATGRETILRAEGAYHGTTLGALSCTGRGPYRDGFKGRLADFPEVPFGDAGALRRALAERPCAAFIVEPVQAEAGMRVAPPGYLAAAREACRERGSLFILDEVQTGMGRTGELFAFRHWGVEPDALVLAKSLGGGVVPLGAAVFAKGLWEKAWPGIEVCEAHNSTFGGNPLSCAGGLAALEALRAPELLAEVRRKGERLFAELRRRLRGRPLVADVSGIGLLGGIRLRESGSAALSWEGLGVPELAGRPAAAALAVERLLRQDVFAQICGHDWSVLRVEPPLVVDDAACDRFVEAVDAAVRWLERA
ncbi:MAG: aspartate aminotransferase family protein [Elusimicrobia bacterium]|nr:aspartate aminotransferase family protein [Elusimicrobiota bacterium]